MSFTFGFRLLALPALVFVRLPAAVPVAGTTDPAPGNEQNLDLAQAARRAGWTEPALHYRGSKGSSGAFSFRYAFEDATAAVAYLRTPETI